MLIISNKQTNDFIKRTKLFDEFGLVIKCVSAKNWNKAKEWKRVFLWMLRGILASILSGNPLIGKVTIRAVEETIRAGQDL